MGNKINSTDVASTLTKLTNDHCDEEKDFWFEKITKYINNGQYGIDDAEVYFWLNNIDYRCIELIKIYLRLNKIGVSVIVDLFSVCYVRERRIREALIELMVSGEFTKLDNFISEFNEMLVSLYRDVEYDRNLMETSKRHKNMLNIFGNNYTIEDFYDGFDSLVKLNIII